MALSALYHQRAVTVHDRDRPGLAVGHAGSDVVAPGHHPVAGADAGPVHSGSDNAVVHLARRYPQGPSRLVQLPGVGVGGHRHRQCPLPARLPGRLGRHGCHRFLPVLVHDHRPPLQEGLGHARGLSPVPQLLAHLRPALVGDGDGQAVGASLEGQEAVHLAQGDFTFGRPPGGRLHHPAPAHRPQLAGVSHQAEGRP